MDNILKYQYRWEASILIFTNDSIVDKMVINKIFINKNDFENKNFVELLSNANTGIGTWEPGWEIFDIEKNGRIIVKKNELKLWILRSQFIPSDANNITIGNKGFLAMVKEFRELLPGFYMANGNVSLKKEFQLYVYIGM